MNAQAARNLTGVSRITSFTPMVNSVIKPIKQSINVCGQGAQFHYLDNHHCACMWRTISNTAASSATVKFTSNYGCMYQRKQYSTESTPRKTSDKQEAKYRNGFAGGEVDSETNFVKDETGGESRNRGKIKRYVRRASIATEKMKEKMADTVKDMNENIFTIPNLLSTTRLVMSPILGYLVIQECYTLGTCLFVVAGMTDLLDGFIARNFKNQQSVLGSIIDPLADKCLVAILTLSLTVSGLIPVPLTILMISRDVGLVGSVVYLRYQSLPPPRTVSRFFDITHATVQLKPTTISKLNTAVQLGLVGFTLAAPVFNYVDHPLLHALWYATAATTILSGLSYIFSKDAFKFLRK